MHLHLPHAGDEGVWIEWIEGQARAAHLLAREQHPRPMLAAVGGPEDAAFLLRPRRLPEDTGEYDVGIRGVDGNAADPSELRQSQVRPGRAGVGGLVDSVAHHVAVADDPGLAGPRPHRARL